MDKYTFPLLRALKAMPIETAITAIDYITSNMYDKAIILPVRGLLPQSGVALPIEAKDALLGLKIRLTESINPIYYNSWTR